MEILILLKSNIKQRKGNFIGILLFMTIIIALLISTITIKGNLESHYTKANKNVNSGDLIVYIENENLDKKLLEKVSESSEVESVINTETIVVPSLSINDKKLESYIYLTLEDRETYPYRVFDDNTNEVVVNDNFLKGNEIYVPIVLKKTYSIKVSDKVKINVNGVEVEYTIKGFIEEPFMGADVMGARLFVLSNEGYNNLANVGDKGLSYMNLVHVSFNNPSNTTIENLTKTLDEETNIIKQGVTSLTINQSKSYTLLISNILCGVLIGFVAILFVIVVLVLSNNIKTSIEMEYENIGVLKSQGFSKGKIRTILLLQHLLPAVLGSILGMILSKGISTFMRDIFMQTTGLVFSTNFILYKSLICIFVLLALLIIIIFLKTKRVANISPIVAISGGLEPVYFNSRFNTKVISNKKNGLLFRLGARQLVSNLKQYIGTVIVLTILVLFVSLTTAFQATFTEKYYNEIFGIVNSDILVVGDEFEGERENIEEIISKHSKIKDGFYFSSKNVTIDDYQNLVQILDSSNYLTKVLEGRAPIYDNEIAITNLVKNQIGKGIGEKVIVNSGKESETYIITGLYDSCSDVGRCFTMTLDGAKRISKDIQQNSRNYIIEDSSLAKEVIDDINKNYESNGIKASKPSALNEEVMQTVLDASNIMCGFIYFISILFAIITVAMVCNKVFYKERVDMGIYKAFGFTSRELRLQFCVRFLILSIISSILGSITYILIGNKINALVLSLAGVATFNGEKTFFNVGFPGVIITIFVVIFSYISMRKINNVDIKELVME